MVYINAYPRLAWVFKINLFRQNDLIIRFNLISYDYFYDLFVYSNWYHNFLDWLKTQNLGIGLVQSISNCMFVQLKLRLPFISYFTFLPFIICQIYRNQIHSYA